MDAIILFCKKRNRKQWKLSLNYREDYLLAKVETDIGRNDWFGIPIPTEPVRPEETRSRSGLRGRLEQRKRKKEYERQVAEYSCRKEELETNIRRMVSEVLTAVEEAGAKGELGCVYEEELAFLTKNEAKISKLWAQYWNIPEFRGYHEFRWVRPLLPAARGPYFILLGIAPCIPLLLEHCAGKMKSLCWYLNEEDLGEEVEELAEDFYTEYGLAVTLLPLSGRNTFRSLRLKSEEPVCILDFTQEEKIYAGELSRGSVWLDFGSSEEKKKRMLRLSPGVRYDSLKSLWERSRHESQNKTNFTISDNSEKKPLFL